MAKQAQVLIQNSGRGYRAWGPNDIGDPNQFTRLKNALIDDGSIRKRGGYAQFQAGLTGGVSVNSAYFTGALATNVLVATANSRIAWVEANGTEHVIASGLTAGARWSFAEYPQGGTNWVLMFSPTDPPQKWDGAAGATVAMAGPAANCGLVCIHKERIWASGSPTFPIRVYIGELSTLDPWDARAFFDMPGDRREGVVTGMVSLIINKLTVFRERATYSVYGSDPGRVSAQTDLELKKISDIGCVSSRSIVRIEDTTYFLGTKNGYYGVFATDGGEVWEVSSDIRADLNAVNTAQLQQACATQLNRHYLLTFPSGVATETTVGVLLHLGMGREKPFAQWVFANMPRCFALDPKTATVYWGAQASGQVWKYTPAAYVDNATPIDLDVISGPQDFGDADRTKTLEDLEFQTKVVASGSVAASFSMDGAAAFTAFKGSPLLTDATGTWGGVKMGVGNYTWNGNAIGIMRVERGPGVAAARARIFRIRFQENSVNYAEIHRASLAATIEET